MNIIKRSERYCTHLSSYTSFLSSLPMQRHPNTPAKPIFDIQLQDVPPLYDGRRADYHAMLLRLVRAAPGVRIFLDTTVRAVQPDPTVAGGPSVTLSRGEVLHADVIIGADGVKSTLQKAVTGLDDKPTPT